MGRKEISPLTTPRATESILESISDGVFTVDHEWRITSFNRAAEEITRDFPYGRRHRDGRPFDCHYTRSMLKRDTS